MASAGSGEPQRPCRHPSMDLGHPIEAPPTPRAARSRQHTAVTANRAAGTQTPALSMSACHTVGSLRSGTAISTPAASVNRMPATSGIHQVSRPRRTLQNETLGYSLPIIAYEGGPSLFTDTIDLGAQNGSGVPTDDHVTTWAPCSVAAR